MPFWRERKREVILSEQALIKTASRFFVRASAEYPASVTFQGTCIATMSAKEHLNPESLRDALLNDKDQLRKIIETATSVHKKQGVGLSVSMGQVRGIINHDFPLATTMMKVSPEVRGEIQQVYPVYRTIHERIKGRPRATFILEETIEDIFKKIATSRGGSDSSVAQATILLGLSDYLQPEDIAVINRIFARE